VFAATEEKDAGTAEAEIPVRGQLVARRVAARGVPTGGITLTRLKSPSEHIATRDL